MHALPFPVSGAPSLDARPFGASLVAGGRGATFRVWAPKARMVTLVVDGAEHAMADEGGGVRMASISTARVGSRYGFRLDGGPVFPDPSSRAQPEGVHGLSAVVDPQAYRWANDDWGGVAAERLVVYELHVGTFTPEGTLAAAGERLAHLRETGITAVELMPLHAYAGRFGWGYDPGAFLAVHPAYGTPDDLRRFVDRAHGEGLAVVVDVVLNHLGPDGAYVNAYAPMLTAADTPWGDAVNLDGHQSAGVRRFLLDAALVWLAEYRADGLRIDATSALHDTSSPHLLAELSAAAAALPGPRRWLVAEDLRNRALPTRPRADGGHGLDSQWVDDLSFIARLRCGDTAPYYADYHAAADAHGLADAVAHGWWRTAPETRHAHDAYLPTPPDADAPAARVTAYLDTHDQSGNRPRGERLAAQAPPGLYRALTALLLLAPQTPMLWMGEEWAATTPFPFFCDHAEPTASGVRAGRAQWYADWWGLAPSGAPETGAPEAGAPETGADLPEPVSKATFESARLDWAEMHRPQHAFHRTLVRDLLALRRSLDPHAPFACTALSADALVLRRGPLALVVALVGGAHALPGDLARADVVLSTGDAAPDLHGGALRCAGPVAVVLRPA